MDISKIDRAISIRQPWAWLICDFKGVGRVRPKRIENRPTLKHLKGKFFVHAGSQFDKLGYDMLVDKIMAEFLPHEAGDFFHELPAPSFFQCGGIVGWLEFSGKFVTDSDDFWYVPGQNGMIIKDAGELPFHRCAGMLGTFAVDLPMPYVEANK